MPKKLDEPSTFNIFDQDIDNKTEIALSSSSALAVDTEAMGLIHGRDRLCLIQICDEFDNVICIRIERNQHSAPRLKFILENKLFLSPNLARYHWKYWNQKTCSVETNMIYVSLISSCRFFKFLAQLKILNKYKIIIYNNSDIFLV